MAWTRAASRAALDGRDLVGVEVGGRRVVLYRLDGAVFATSGTCPHAGAPLARGCVVEGYVECPVHHALFDIRTGEADGAITSQPLRTFATRVEDDVIYVDLPMTEERMP